MYYCEICGKKADIHHIIHRSQGGLDFPLNYKYLCQEHHRGKNGPHKSPEIDLKYKLELQSKLLTLLHKRYYTTQELYSMLDITNNSLKRLTKKMKLYKEGYLTDDLIFCLMGNYFYTYEMLEDLKLEHLVLKLSW
ncbi:HNH endonuclease [Clostridium sp. 'White wine YQ']|uniref:HNH endonuclease n=1 Tax=Clostridium sp. 'White wine YQ' TaxID=3027474 RepID=UPI002366C830|nr:HNH endonuclease signature motif containing protein [Clostridium sp. 'White wine YQ']MDD7795827.1 HNH endonuclease signature motif containing protein [Clostridium sp. 'White wine YQ']